jgi:hypothetical protein
MMPGMAPRRGELALRRRLRAWLDGTPYARPAAAMIVVGVVLLVVATVLAIVAL